MVPYWSASADLVTVPHRGYWGRPLSKGPAENTMAALKAALTAGYRAIEVDAALSGPYQSGVRKVFLGHYFNMNAAGGSPNKTPHDYPADELVKFKMRKRDQSKSVDNDDHLPLIAEAITWAAQHQVLLMIDPKTPQKPIYQEHNRIIALVLNEARQRNALSNIVIKSVNSRAMTIDGISKYLDQPFSLYDGKFLWSPIVNKSKGSTKENTLRNIDEWHHATTNSKQVISYELGLFNSNHWAATHFTWLGNDYINLIDYVKKLTPTGKRAAAWSIDAIGDKGTLDREYRWKFLGNSELDKRGNPFRNLSYELSRHLLINTDRPEWYESFVIPPY